MTTRILWFRRDLRLGDHPALLAAADGARVLPLFVLDPRLAAPGPRLDRLLASLAALRDATSEALVIRSGDPASVVPTVAREVGAHAVHVSAESTPYGRRRDALVRERLPGEGVEFVETGSPYAVTPGRVRNRTGDPYRVFTPFLHAWRDHGWRAPAGLADVAWVRDVDSLALPQHPQVDAGERAALERWQSFLAEDLDGYATDRDRPDLDSTSRLSVALKYGEIHPRTLLADLLDVAADAAPADIERYVTELAWREFHADVLHHAPNSTRDDLRPTLRRMPHDPESELVDAWRAGRTGFPFVDAGMRQLLHEGWMHNRVRMVTASFLVKDLHVRWTLGARHFLDHLIDGDIASNTHNWQWAAGTGTDAAPYFRIFNPVRQGLRFDPSGDYVRRWIPELRHLDGATAHEPWRHADGHRHGYPERIIDHAQERREALARLTEVKEHSR